MLYAFSRAGLAPGLAEVDQEHGTPARSILVMGTVNLVCLFLWGARSDAVRYGGNIVTIGTLALILVYIGVTASHAIGAFRSRRPVRWMIGSLSAVLLLWPLWNSLYPVPHWPGNIWPYVVATWLVLGVLTAILRPSAIQIHASKTGGSLHQQSDLPGPLPL